MRQCMEDLDVAGVRRLWSEVSPHLPQPTDDADALATAVGVASRSRHREVKQAVQGAMLYAVQEAEADGRLLDSPYVRTRIREARLRERRALFGRFDSGEEHSGQDFRDITGG
jgi:hypothetical protein